MAQAISWIATLYVARILTPADYGLVAMALVPIGFARLVEDLGLDTILLQDRTLDHEQIASLAGVVLCLGVILTLVFMLLARPLARYFHEPVVALLIMALSLTFISDALQVVPRALLQRDLEFRTLAWLHGLQVALAALVVVASAKLSMGYWALVLNSLVSNTVITIALCIIRPFRLTWPRHLPRIAAPLLSGWRMMVSRAAYYGYTSLDSVVIGRALGKEALGVFGFAMTFASLPLTEVSSVVSKVVPGIFSAVQDSSTNLRRYFLLLTEALSYITLPMSVGLLLTADDFILLVLGPQWEAVVLPLRVLSVYMAVNSAQMLLSHVLLWTGWFRANMWLNILTVVALPVCFYVGVHWGVAGVAWAWTIGFPLTTIPALLLVNRIIGMRVSDYFAALRAATLACLAMCVCVLLARHSLPTDLAHAPRLAVQVATGVAAYSAALLGGFHRRVSVVAKLIRESRHGTAADAA